MSQSRFPYTKTRGENMDLSIQSEENLAFILQELGKKLGIVNQIIIKPEDYDINRYDDLKDLYDMVIQKGKLTVSETEAFIDELRSVRKGH